MVHLHLREGSSRGVWLHRIPTCKFHQLNIMIIITQREFKTNKRNQYWDWPLYADAPQDSPIFNGDAYSMSGNGVFSPHNGTIIGGTPGLTTIQLAAGLGGGCVTTGPFKNMSVNLGPVSLDGAATGPNGGLGYNPRCLKRDVGPGVAKKYTNATAVSSKFSFPEAPERKYENRRLTFSSQLSFATTTTSPTSNS